jgi:hypothetical protein
VQQQARHFAGGVEDEGVRARQMRLEHAERAGVDLGEQPSCDRSLQISEVVLVIQLRRRRTRSIAVLSPIWQPMA